MKNAVALIICLLAGLALGYYVGARHNGGRYELHSSSPLAIYRLDRATGQVEISRLGRPWEKISSGANPVATGWTVVQDSKP